MLEEIHVSKKSRIGFEGHRGRDSSPSPHPCPCFCTGTCLRSSREPGCSAGRKVGASCLARRFTDEGRHLAFLLWRCDCRANFGVSSQLPSHPSELPGRGASVTELFQDITQHWALFIPRIRKQCHSCAIISPHAPPRPCPMTEWQLATPHRPQELRGSHGRLMGGRRLDVLGQLRSRGEEPRQGKTCL